MESAKRQGVYSTEREGASTRVEEPQEPPEHPDQRVYTRAFKREAVRWSETSEQTVAQIARDRGVPERVLSRWRHERREQQNHQERALPGNGHQSELEEEHRRLRRELEWLTQERELLQKALGIFSRGPSCSPPSSPATLATPATSATSASSPSGCCALPWRSG